MVIVNTSRSVRFLAAKRFHRCDGLVRDLNTIVAITGAVRLDFTYGLHATGCREEGFDIIDRASFAHVFDRDGAPVAGGLGETTPAIIFAVPKFPMMRDIRFVQLCAKLGLCDYWVKGDIWPDCAEQVAEYYDFKAEARRLVASV